MEFQDLEITCITVKREPYQNHPRGWIDSVKNQSLRDLSAQSPAKIEKNIHQMQVEQYFPITKLPPEILVLKFFMLNF